ncbi:hypothetical protein Glove_67g9 [Diversispora epigaea]|uniref:ZSWIM1/3 RNaseH-like domain-containing protein n=1 Tax=Diversispora epigaea TaxID=1348612 RepID=A0A397JK02_9GLOM|nr:hypothetical protein Glove_67g9 [Diversispora epigaea]
MNSLNENLSSLDNTSDRNSLSCNNMNKNNSNELTKVLLYKGMSFNSWQEAFYTIENWAKTQGFNIVYNCVIQKPDGTFRKSTVQCEHQGNYRTKTNTTTKRIRCTWHINLSEPPSNNPFKHIYITTLHDIHSHNLNPNIIQFGDNKQISPEILKEIEFLTVKCKMGAAMQPIQNFWPQNKNDNNDAAKLYTKLLESSLNNPMGKVAIKFDNNNTLTHLFWMTPSQLELWYQFSDIVVQNVTCKTNRYDMALSLFIILDENRNIRLVAQALLIDETKESHEWTFD